MAAPNAHQAKYRAEGLALIKMSWLKFGCMDDPLQKKRKVGVERKRVVAARGGAAAVKKMVPLTKQT
jgi:hypothetical protein